MKILASVFPEDLGWQDIDSQRAFQNTALFHEGDPCEISALFQPSFIYVSILPFPVSKLNVKTQKKLVHSVSAPVAISSYVCVSVSLVISWMKHLMKLISVVFLVFPMNTHHHPQQQLLQLLELAQWMISVLQYLVNY